MTTLPTQMHTIADLVARHHEGNYKLHDVEGIIASILRHGFTAPPTIDDTTGKLVAGHGRTKALSKMKADGMKAPKRIAVDEDTGEWLVPTLHLEFADDEERDAYLIADNQLGAAGGVDEQKLAALLSKFKRTDLKSMGYTRAAYDELMGKFKTDASTSALDQDSLEKLDNGVRIFSDDVIAEACFDYYRHDAGFPYPNPALHEACNDLNKMAAMPLKALIRTVVGYGIADKFQQHRFLAAAEKMKSPVESFLDDEQLKRAIDLIMKFDAFVSPSALRGTISMVRGTQACANFRPGFAAYLYRRFCPVGGVVLDTSTGYGGRLVGALASTVVKHYIGIDPNTKTAEGNERLLHWLGRSSFARLIKLPAEDVQTYDEPIAFDGTPMSGSPLSSSELAQAVERESCDFSFTSPPYFRKEHYSEEATQSYKRYPEPEQWRRGFLVPMMRLTFDALKRGTFAIVNIADVMVDGERHPLGQWTVDAGQEVGLRLVERLDFPMTRRFGANQNEGVATEPVYVFRKD